jgi:hypothetical protein
MEDMEVLELETVAGTRGVPTSSIGREHLERMSLDHTCVRSSRVSLAVSYQTDVDALIPCSRTVGRSSRSHLRRDT